MSLLKIAELEGQLTRRDERILELEAALDALNETTGAKLAAQRKVLEQAQKSLSMAVLQNGCDTSPQYRSN